MLTGSLPPISRRATYTETIAFDDPTTGDPIDLTGADILVEIRCGWCEDDYGHRHGRADLTATLDDGVTMPEMGVIVIRFEAGTFDRFGPGAALLTVLITRDGETAEPIHLSLPIEG